MTEIKIFNDNFCLISFKEGDLTDEVEYANQTKSSTAWKLKQRRAARIIDEVKNGEQQYLEQLITATNEQLHLSFHDILQLNDDPMWRIDDELT